MDRLSLPIVVVVGRATERTARDDLAQYVTGSGPRSLKKTIESGAYAAFDTVRVTGIEFDVYTIGATDYLAAIFDLDIAGTGR